MDFDLIRSCYHDDAIENHGWYLGGIDGFMSFLRERMSGDQPCTHFLGNQLIDIDGDVAYAETYCLALIRVGCNNGEPLDRMHDVRYCDRFERRDGSWRIAHRVVAYGPEWFGSANQLADAPQNLVRSVRGPTDVVYRLRDL